MFDNLLNSINPIKKFPPNPNQDVKYDGRELREIWLAGGCFWGVEAYIKRIYGVAEVVSGYVNGDIENPTYEDVCAGNTGFTEGVHVSYDPTLVNLDKILTYFFKIIDPTLLNQQGNDIGSQYRTGIYYNDLEDFIKIKMFVLDVQKKYDKLIVTEVKAFENFYPAEEYHQDYLSKNPNGYCHIDFSSLEQESSHNSAPILTDKPDDDTLRDMLTTMQYEVTQKGKTEPAFENKYWNNHEPGIYVDIVTGEPLFSSKHKFDFGCGWPSFTKTITPDVTKVKPDKSYGLLRNEVRSSIGDSHLGHVFEDGPIREGGLRYCINSASMKFIPLDDMDKKGYGNYIKFVK